jgi:hypothetical protein
MSRPLLPGFVGQRPQAVEWQLQIVARLFPRSQLHGRVNCHSDPSRAGERTMRAYITVAGITVGLVALWSVLVPLVA